MIDRVHSATKTLLRRGAAADELDRPTLPLAGLLVMMILWQSTLISMLWLEAISAQQYVEAHYIGTLAIVARLALAHNRVMKRDTHHARLQIVGWTVLLGPLGPLVSLAFLMPARLAPASPRAPFHDPDADRELSKHLHALLLDNRVRLVGPSETKPLFDVLAEGRQSEKLEALGVIYRRYEPDFSAVLKHGLRDMEPSVRVLAATVSAKLHGAYVQKIGRLQEAAARDPNYGEHWRNLAESRLDYANSGLLESSRARAQIDAAARDLTHAAEEGTLQVLERIDQARGRLMPERTAFRVAAVNRHDSVRSTR